MTVMTYYFKWLGLFFTIFLLAACQTPKKVVEGGDRLRWLSSPVVFKEAYKQHADLTQWRYSAKVGIVTPESNQQANMVWLFDAEKTNTVRLFGPLGIGAVKIEFNDQGVVLSNRSGELYKGDNAQLLLEEIVGWPIPVDALQYWLFALPLPQQDFAYLLDENGEVEVLKQLGWQVNYSQYRDYVDGRPRLARKIIATKQVTSEQSLKVTLITKSWK